MAWRAGHRASTERSGPGHWQGWASCPRRSAGPIQTGGEKRTRKRRWWRRRRRRPMVGQVGISRTAVIQSGVCIVHGSPKPGWPLLPVCAGATCMWSDDFCPTTNDRQSSMWSVQGRLLQTEPAEGWRWVVRMSAWCHTVLFAVPSPSAVCILLFCEPADPLSLFEQVKRWKCTYASIHHCLLFGGCAICTVCSSFIVWCCVAPVSVNRNPYRTPIVIGSQLKHSLLCVHGLFFFTYRVMKYSFCTQCLWHASAIVLQYLCASRKGPENGIYNIHNTQLKNTPDDM